ncbi:MAG: outer membrane protein transport protein, partial [Psychrosphaera sp.]|nr:outer membrane protein transport protein [Psychrosphaera sp.]
MLLYTGASVADPWTTFPGTKARGMGTAFVAIANDPSAAWHNPAGLYQMKGMNISLEGGNAPKYDLDDGHGMVFNQLKHPQTGDTIDNFYGSSWTDTVKGNESYFLSWNMGNGKTYGLGLYYYQPYNIETTQLRGIIDHLRGYIVEDVSIYGSGYSGDLYLNKDSKWFSSLHYGFTVEFIDVNTDGSELEFDLDGTDTNIKPIPIDSIDVQEGWTGSFGFLATILNVHLGERWSPTVKVGGVYR